MPWIITNKPRVALRVAYFVEGRFPDVEECTQEGDGIQETRPEYLRKYRARVFVRPHPDGVRWAIWLSTLAKAKFDAWRTTIQQRRAAGTATADEVEADDLPADVAALDASWDAPAVPPA